jgi:hypothetical protein
MMKHIDNFDAFKVNEAYDEDIQYYMFFKNLEVMKHKIDYVLSKDFHAVDELLKNGHDWAASHVASAAEEIGQVCDFICSELHTPGSGKMPTFAKSGEQQQ